MTEDPNPMEFPVIVCSVFTENHRKRVLEGDIVATKEQMHCKGAPTSKGRGDQDFEIALKLHRDEITLRFPRLSRLLVVQEKETSKPQAEQDPNFPENAPICTLSPPFFTTTAALTAYPEVRELSQQTIEAPQQPADLQNQLNKP